MRSCSTTAGATVLQFALYLGMNPVSACSRYAPDQLEELVVGLWLASLGLLINERPAL